MEILEAGKKDTKRADWEWMFESGSIMSDLSSIVDNLHEWMKPEKKVLREAEKKKERKVGCC